MTTQCNSFTTIWLELLFHLPSQLPLSLSLFSLWPPLPRFPNSFSQTQPSLSSPVLSHTSPAKTAVYYNNIILYTNTIILNQTRLIDLSFHECVLCLCINIHLKSGRDMTHWHKRQCNVYSMLVQCNFIEMTWKQRWFNQFVPSGEESRVNIHTGI